MPTQVKKVRLAPVIAMLALALTACGEEGGAQGGSSFADPSQGVSPTSVDFGLIYDQTGATASTQVPFASGIMTAFEQANESGGVNGRTINPVECDEKYEVAAGVACLKAMIDQTPVVGVSGLNNGSFQVAAVELVKNARIPVIGPQSTSEPIVNPFPGYIWATMCPYPSQADVSVAFAARELLGKDDFRAVGLGGNVASGDSYLNQIAERVEKMGATYVETIKYDMAAPNLDQQAQRISTIDPDVIFMHGGASQGVTALKSLAKFGVTDTPTLAIFGLLADQVPLAAPNVGDDFYVMHCFSNAKLSDIPGVPKMIEAAKAAGYGEEIYNTTDFANGYVNGLVIVEALKRAGDELTRESLNEAVSALENFDTQGLSPFVSFSSDDSVGIDSVRPYKFDFENRLWQPVGDFEDYEDCIAHEFVEGNIEAWSPDCIQ